MKKKERPPGGSDLLLPQASLAYIGTAVARLMRQAQHRRTIRLVARACVHWAATLMEAVMTERQFALWCSHIYRAVKDQKVPAPAADAGQEPGQHHDQSAPTSRTRSR